jgi:hypothetical protein
MQCTVHPYAVTAGFVVVVQRIRAITECSHLDSA